MKKVVLIGAGNIGKQALECLGSELVAYFIDNRKAGFTYLDKPVYPIGKLLQDEGKYLFLLTIANIEFRDDFIDQLNRMGINDYYFFEQAIYTGSIFQKSNAQVYKRRTLYEDMMEIDPERVCILGYKRKIGRFVAELFEIKSFYDEEEYYSISEWSKQYDYVFINVKKYSSELHNQLKNVRDTNIKLYYIAHYYDCYNYFAKKGLVEFAGKYKGKKRCFIIGNGPSLAPEDLNVLAENNEICFGANMVHKIYSKTKWRPNYICICDKLVVSQTLDYILETNVCPVVVTDAVQLYLSPFQYDNTVLYHEVFNRDDDYRIIRFGTNLSSGNILSGWTALYIAMQLAVYMGFEEIYLLGVDNSNLTGHFCKDYQSEAPIMNEGSQEVQVMVMQSAYKRAKSASVEYGFKIYNATRGGCLEEFERVNFDELFN